METVQCLETMESMLTAQAVETLETVESTQPEGATRKLRGRSCWSAGFLLEGLRVFPRFSCGPGRNDYD
jgi:hypothetical protein